MKIILIGLGIALISFALFLAFGITVSTLKEHDDENIYKYLTMPTLLLAIGIISIIKGVKSKHLKT